ncbi:MAG TPA: hypothetical protein PK887_04160 [Ignavibacteriales bacterium]|nr:hypothetical protein [Ignavibacteriales bacterium]
MKIIKFLLLFSTLIFAQSDTLNNIDEDINDTPNQNYFMVANRLTFGGGINFNFVNVNIDPINDALFNKFISKKLKSNMFGIGGEGFASLMIVPNLRIGGFGYSASQEDNRVIDINNQKYSQNVAVEYSNGGISIDYLLPFIRSFGLIIGTNLAYGEYKVSINQNKSYFLWNDIGNNQEDNNIINRQILCKFYTLSPNIKIEIPLNNFIMFRTAFEYNFSFKNEYKQDDNRTLYNVPDKFNGDSYNIVAGIYFGLFNY